jgi:hypothetical protein
MSGFLIIPSALIHVSGMATLSLSELRLLWRIIGAVSAHKMPEEDEHGWISLRLPVDDLLEPGETQLRRLVERLDAISEVRFRVNLDGRDKGELWRMKLFLLPEWEMDGEWVELSIGPKMARAIKDRETFASVRESALFSMRGSRYAALFYVLIRDKANQRMKRWEVELPYFREVMQLQEGTYRGFDDLKKRVIEPAVSEVSENSEFIVRWTKGRTHKNAVRSLVFTWEEKDGTGLRRTAKEAGRHSRARGKTQDGADAPPLISLTEKAVKWLKSADHRERTEWSERAIELGMPREKAGIAPIDKVLRSWAGLVAPEMREKGLIRG